MVRSLALAVSLALVLPAMVVPVAAQTQNPSFNLVNRSQTAIRELFVTPAGDASWGQNRIATPIAAGASFAVRRRVDGNCNFDIRVIYADGAREERHLVNTCAAEDVAFGVPRKAANDAGFRLVNHDRQAIAELFAHPAGQAGGANLLAAPVAPNGAAEVKPQGPGCRFELRVVFADRSSKSRTTDLCATTELVVP